MKTVKFNPQKSVHERLQYWFQHIRFSMNKYVSPRLSTVLEGCKSVRNLPIFTNLQVRNASAYLDSVFSRFDTVESIRTINLPLENARNPMILMSLSPQNTQKSHISQISKRLCSVRVLQNLSKSTVFYQKHKILIKFL